MIAFLKENGFPMTIFIETSDFKDTKEGFEGYISVVTDDEGNVISEFTHADLRARVHWSNGFFTALRKNLKK